MTISMFLLIFIDEKFGLGMTDDHINLFVVPFMTLIYLLFIFPTLRNDFLKRFLHKENITNSICIPILTSITLVFIINLSRLIPLFFGGSNVIGVGSAQYIEQADLSVMGELLFHALIPTFSEEFLFRYLCFGGLFVLVTNTLLPSDKVVAKLNKFELAVERFRTKMFIEKNRFHKALLKMLVRAEFLDFNFLIRISMQL
jgi:hypothetical protein